MGWPVANDPAAIAAKLAALYQPAEPQEPATEPAEEPAPIGPGNHIPSAGHQPDAAVLAKAAKRERDKFAWLAEMLDNQ